MNIDLAGFVGRGAPVTKTLDSVALNVCAFFVVGAVLDGFTAALLLLGRL